MQKTGNIRELSQYNKGCFRKPITKVILTGENVKAVPSKIKNKTECPVLPLLFSIVMEVLTRAIRQEKKLKAF